MFLSMKGVSWAPDPRVGNGADTVVPHMIQGPGIPWVVAHTPDLEHQAWNKPGSCSAHSGPSLWKPASQLPITRRADKPTVTYTSMERNRPWNIVPCEKIWTPKPPSVIPSTWNCKAGRSVDRRQVWLPGADCRQGLEIWGGGSVSKWVVLTAGRLYKFTKNNWAVHAHWWLVRHVNYVLMKLFEKREKGKKPRQHRPACVSNHTAQFTPQRVTLSEDLGLVFLCCHPPGSEKL